MTQTTIAIAARNTQDPSSRCEGGTTSSVRIAGRAAARTRSQEAFGCSALIAPGESFCRGKRRACGSLQKRAEETVVGDDLPSVEQRERERAEADTELQWIDESLQLSGCEIERQADQRRHDQ